MSDLKTVLIFSRFFPPMFDVGGKRAYRFARYLPDYGWRAVIVTDDPAQSAGSDPTAGEPLPDVHSIRRVYYPSWWPPRADAGSDGTKSGPTRQTDPKRSGLRERVAHHIQTPAGKDVWLAPRAAMIARNLAKEENISAIFATSSPYAALLFGVAAKYATGLPLCLDLRDPWSMNFLQRSKSPFTRFTEASMERRLLHSADRITFTCRSAVDAYREAYPKIESDRIRCIYNSFDPAQQPEVPAEREGPVTLMHFGNCYGARRLDTLLNAIHRVKERTGITSDELQLVNLGRMAEKDLNLSDRLGITDYVTARPFVPYSEGLELLARADLQVLLSYGSETLFVPAKLYDYLLTGAPILCVAPDSEVSDIVRETGSGLCIQPNDVEACAQAISSAINARKSKTSVCDRQQDAIDGFSAPNTARQLAALLDELVD